MQKRFFLLLLLSAFAGAFPGQAQTTAFNFSSLVQQAAFQQAASAVSAATGTETAAPEEEAFVFSTRYTGTGNLLNWDLPREEDIASLVIEGSADGAHFIDLEALEQSEAEALDLFYDASPQGRRYYRLIANYENGEQRITPIVSVAGIPEKPLTVALLEGQPGALRVESRHRIELYDLQGQLLKSAYPQEGSYILDLQALPRGQYLVRAGNERRLVQY